MKNKSLLILVLTLTAVMLFFVILSNGRETLQRQDVLQSSAWAPLTGRGDSVRSVDDEVMNPETPFSLKYGRYPATFVYFVVNGGEIPVYSSPDQDRHVIRTAQEREKLSYVETVTIQKPGEGVGESASETDDREEETWYHVYWYVGADGQVISDGSAEGAEKNFGFILEGSAEKRRFRIDAMAGYVKKAEDFMAEGSVAHIVNYKNGNGKPPLYKGKATDAAGNMQSQSAPGYPVLSDKKEFTYLADGTLVKVLEGAVAADGTAGENASGSPCFRKVLCLADGKTYYVPLKYIPRTETLTELTKVVVVDRTNQNEGAFEKIDGSWSCVSFTMATTGTKNQYASPTPLGYYLMIEKRPQFYYTKDGTTEVQGYAPYVLRFCGGAYIHGVPVPYQYRDGKRITPPKKEYSPTMGTIPLSHKCVRNYTSHAEFLYNWYESGKTAVIVIE